MKRIKIIFGLIIAALVFFSCSAQLKIQNDLSDTDFGGMGTLTADMTATVGETDFGEVMSGNTTEFQKVGKKGIYTLELTFTTAYIDGTTNALALSIMQSAMGGTLTSSYTFELPDAKKYIWSYSEHLSEE